MTAADLERELESWIKAYMHLRDGEQAMALARRYGASRALVEAQEYVRLRECYIGDASGYNACVHLGGGRICRKAQRERLEQEVKRE